MPDLRQRYPSCQSQARNDGRTRTRCCTNVSERRGRVHQGQVARFDRGNGVCMCRNTVCVRACMAGGNREQSCDILTVDFPINIAKHHIWLGRLGPHINAVQRKLHRFDRPAGQAAVAVWGGGGGSLYGWMCKARVVTALCHIGSVNDSSSTSKTASQRGNQHSDNVRLSVRPILPSPS